MRNLRIVGRAKALSPVFHGGDEKTGSVVLLNRMKFLVNGKHIDIPIISGNSIRGRMRRLLAADFLSNVGYEIDLKTEKGKKLFHTLFAGGLLTEVEEKETGVLDLTLKKKVVDHILPIRLFGASYKNQIVEGRLKVMHMLPICKELSEYTGVESDKSIYSLIGRTFQTRRDELRERSEDEEAVQMLIEYEVFIPGTEFYHEIIVRNDPLDISTIARAIKLWNEDPYIGGKSAIGFGKLKLSYDLNADDTLYLKFCEEKKEGILNTLGELVDLL